MLDNSIRAKLYAVYGKEIRYPKDCDGLASDITAKTGCQISSSTVKRLLGFIKTSSHPNQYTLDTISNYIGFPNWAALNGKMNENTGEKLIENSSVNAGSKNKKRKWVISLILIPIIITGVFLGVYKQMPKKDSITFQELSALPQPRCGGRAIISKNQIYYLGGFNCGLTTDNNWRFDYKNNRWTTLSAMPTRRAEMATAVVDNQIYCFGGWLGNSQGSTDKSEVYQIQRNTWDTLPNLPEKITGASAVAIGKDIYIVGGKTGETTSFFFKFNTKKKTFTALPLYHGGIIHMSMVAVNEKIYLMGGNCFQNMKHYWQKRLYEFDIKSNQWTEKAEMPLTIAKSSAVVIKNQIHVFGGIDRYGDDEAGIKDVHLIYDIQKDCWTKGLVLPFPICQHQAITVAENTLIIGGNTSFPNPASTVVSLRL